MKTRKKKAGFTLVELMVVAIIVAILAAVAIPLMSGNKDRAMATEGQAGCTTIATQLRMYWAEFGAPATDMTDLVGIKEGDLNGTYFAHGDYSFTHTAKDEYTVSATSSIATDSDNNAANVEMVVTAGQADWSTSGLLD